MEAFNKLKTVEERLTFIKTLIKPTVDLIFHEEGDIADSALKWLLDEGNHGSFFKLITDYKFFHEQC